MESMIFVEPQLGGIGSHFIPKNHPKILFLDDVDGTQKSGAEFSYNFPPPCMLPNLKISHPPQNCHDIFGYRIL